MKKLIVEVQEHFASENRHGIHILLIGVPAESHLLRMALMETIGTGHCVCVDCPSNDQSELEHFLRELDYPRTTFGVGSLEQLSDELLANLGQEAAKMHAIMLERNNESYVLPKNQITYGVGKTPLKTQFNSHSRQIIKSIRRKK